MFSIRIFIVVNVISLIIARSKDHELQSTNFIDDNDLIIDPLELMLYSNDPQGVIYCNSRRQIDEQGNKLTASIDRPIQSSPKFHFRTEQHNSTTIRIIISPNRFIGTSRIYCHWDHNQTYGQTADLIIGEKPGVIQLKNPCRAYDRRYVQCVFHAPIIARAFQNRFPRLFKFSELDHKEDFHVGQTKLVNVTDNGELVFHFDPRDRSSIPARTDMAVNITLRRFGSAVYRFAIEPVHTTEVDFRIENISSKKLTIRIDHNRTGTISDRLCAGDVQRLDDRKRWRASPDIEETADRTINIDRLRPSTKYEICLRCYYQRTDHSFTEKKCTTITTKFDPTIAWILGGSAVALVILIGFFVVRRFCRVGNHHGSPQPDPLLQPSPSLPRKDSRISLYREIPSIEVDPTDEQYQLIGNDSVMQIIDARSMSPDTRDLT